MKKSRKTRGGRLAHWALMLALSLTVLCAAVPQAEAAKWMEPYLEQVVDWGVMRGDAAGNLNPDRVITRAEFVVMMNRAFGFTEPGPNSFSDVAGSAWYAQDMAIAKKAGYFNGSAEGLAKPGALVTREQAAAMLGRCLRMKGDGVMNTHFSDNQAIGPWSRGLVQECADMGIIQGYEDGTFRPRNHITRGQMACFLTRALGTRIAESGEQSAGGVYGNLTITTPGVTLKDTTISGNLYLTGGVSLESLVLENVHVMGKIIISGGGEAQKGQSSVVLRNVTAQGLEVDSLMDQFVSIRSEGLTNIGNTTVRTSAFMEDLTEKGLGFQTISLEGNREKTELQLAGNIKEVINRTPNSSLIFGQGTVQKVTVDEKATNSQLRVDNYVNVGELNLDTAGKVTGSGSVSHANINAPGSQIDMLPDTITVRPGITGDINHEIMDNIIAAESSEDPRILSGYPVVRNIAPTNADAVFAGNKKGTIHWGLTARSDGSLNQEELLNPQNYKNKILASGTLTVTAAKAEMPAKLSGLVKDGSYYVSALLTDNRGRHSQVKIAAFTTPDDSVPDFATGYPKAEAVKDGDGKLVIQAQVMPTKDCRLFYALLPKGATAPTPNDFKTGSLAGALGWGQVDIHKNVPHLVARVNNASLKEQTDYDLYLWLNDADNGKSSGVRKIVVRTPDMTPPKLIHLDQTDIKDTSVSFSFAMDEPGTLYWAVVRAGTPFLSEEEIGSKLSNMKIETGVGALKKGNVTVGQALRDGNFTVTGLEGQTEYDLYYVIKDRAGNYGLYHKPLVPPMKFKTMDNVPPTVKQEFTHDGSSSDPQRPTPFPDTSIQLVFSERVQGIRGRQGDKIETNDFLELYQKVLEATDPESREKAQNDFAEALHKHIRIYFKPATGVPAENGWEEGETGNILTGKIIDYTKAQVTLDGTSGEMIITFPYDKDPLKNGVHLASGATYYFELENIADTSTPPNQMVGERGVTRLPEFTTIDAQLYYNRGEFSGGEVDGGQVKFDMTFQVTPIMAQNVADSTYWDMLFWTDAHVEIQLYEQPEGGQWKKVGVPVKFEPTSVNKVNIRSLTRDMLQTEQFEQLNKFDKVRNYGVKVTKLGSFKDPTEWNGDVKIDLMAISGDKTTLTDLTTNLSPQKFEENQQSEYRVKIITAPNERFPIRCSFADTKAPKFSTDYPKFMPGDSGVSIDVALDRAGTKFYYVIAEPGKIGTDFYIKKNQVVTLTEADGWDKLPQNGTELATEAHMGEIAPNVVEDHPDKILIMNPNFPGDEYVTGSGNNDGNAVRINLNNKLKADTEYVIYFVLQGGSQDSVSNVYAFRFKTKKVDRPVLTATLAGKTGASVSSRDQEGNKREAMVRYEVILAGSEGQPFELILGDQKYWDPSNEGLTDTKTIERYKKMTFIQAMEESCYFGHNKSQGTVFDLFANNTAKEMVSNVMRSTNTNGSTIIDVGDMELNMGNGCQNNVNLKDKIPRNGKYWFVAVGASVGSSDAFTAVRYLENPENNFLRVVSLETTRTSTVTKDPEKARNQPYSGTLVVAFDSDLYWKDDVAAIPKQIVDYAPPVDSQFVSSVSLCHSAGVSLIHQDPGKTNMPVQHLTFEFKNIMPSSSIVFSSKMCNSSGFSGKTLTLKLTLEQDDEGFYMPKFVLGDGCEDWNGMVG